MSKKYYREGGEEVEDERGPQSVKMRVWMIPLIMSAFGLWGVWSVAKADIENVKAETKRIAPIEQSVAVLNSEVPRLRNDILEIKQSQKEQWRAQREFQDEIQRDIKTLLQKR